MFLYQIYVPVGFLSFFLSLFISFLCSSTDRCCMFVNMMLRYRMGFQYVQSIARTLDMHRIFVCLPSMFVLFVTLTFQVKKISSTTCQVLNWQSDGVISLIFKEALSVQSIFMVFSFHWFTLSTLLQHRAAKKPATEFYSGHWSTMSGQQGRLGGNGFIIFCMPHGRWHISIGDYKFTTACEEQFFFLPEFVCLYLNVNYWISPFDLSCAKKHELLNTVERRSPKAEEHIQQEPEHPSANCSLRRRRDCWSTHLNMNLLSHSEWVITPPSMWSHCS